MDRKLHIEEKEGEKRLWKKWKRKVGIIWLK